MGLLNNWLNKKKKEQLEQAGEKPKDAVLPKEEAKKPAKAKAKTTKTEPKAESKKEVKAVKEQKPETKIKLAENSIAHKVLVKPLVTEKSAVAESANKYSFVVAMWANKLQVKKAVEDIYGVKPLTVNVINVDGRRMHFGKNSGRRSDYKKAIVTLPEGKSIDIHTGV